MAIRNILAAAIMAVSIGAPVAARAQTEPLPVEQAFALTSTANATGSTELRWAIVEGYYLYRDRIAAATPSGEAVALDMPRGETKDDPNFGPMEVFHDAATAALGPVPAGTSAIAVSYQGCQENGICYRPVTRTIQLAAQGDPAAPGQSLADPANGGSERPTQSGVRGAFAAADAGTVVTNLPAATPVAGSGIRIDGASGGLVASLLDDGGAAFAVAMFFLLGLGLAFTPCVFPMYPILAGQLGRQAGRPSARRGLAHSSVYVLAMASAFGLLGVAAAWSGQNLQMALQSTPAIIAVSLVFAGLALSMFGLFELRLPSAWTNAVAGATTGRGGIGSTAALGFTSALIVGPCVTAPLAGALIYIGQTGDVGLGAAALFALGLGQGVPLIAFGTFGAGILPKAGPWMQVVTRAFGIAFLALAIWMIGRILPPVVSLWLWAALLIGVGVALGGLGGRSGPRGVVRRLGQTAGMLALIYGGTLAVGAVAGANDPLRPLAPLASNGTARSAGTLRFDTVAAPEAVAEAIAAGDRPTLLYFTADWCVSCDVIEREVFDDPRVQARLGGYRLLKADVTDERPGTTALMSELSVVGPPTMLFLDPDGAEAPGSRVVGEIAAEDFLERVRLAGGN
ncbi:protein-disulfide reductase DsbD [Aurantimonas endophytica]|uniref:Thiol:disulfide interchange protein DsbD n=1 Tax=Aurantimonas endophytica TaxID=1522175 RepID=A0A7W6HAV6_9HYPH|nr:protein-disulfide reductase DsbD [Aurantimonas endophytica]MBB4001543.1 thiol:disulfide interchange protein DsbD [Aurantimonas endophytica]MCO6402817.1 protein-disulfide reductase DsbD [Aurantimonas endophytica]